MRWFGSFVFALLLSACGNNPALQKPRSLDQFLAYVQAQCTQVRVDTLNLAMAGAIDWQGASRGQQLADSCKDTLEVLRLGTPNLGCLLPSGGDKTGTCGGQQIKAWADAAAWLSRAAAFIASKGKES